jgi:ABC-type thiamine transport system substrate-binding protein
MKSRILLSMIISFSIVITGCSGNKSYKVWIEHSTSSQETIDSAIERLSNAKVDFIIDDNGNVLVNEKELDKAVMCCT